MAIVASDILIKLSITTGTAGNQSAQSNPNASLGKYISTTVYTGGTLHDLFDVISGNENAASVVDYRCIFIHNNHGSLTFRTSVVWIASQVSGGASLAIGLDPTAASGISSASAQAVTIANEITAPAGVTFSTPTSEGTGLSIGDLLPGTCKAIWLRRTAANTAALASDGATLSFSGDTDP